MAQKHTELLEIGIGQIGQDLCLDSVIAERLVVTLKTKAAQPCRYVHAMIPGSEERQPLMNDDTVNDRF